jgi:hypothetical protein
MHSHNKKTRVFHGNCRMPKELEFALLYGIRPKIKIRYKDLSYRKSLAQWWQLLKSNYPSGDESLKPARLPADQQTNLLANGSIVKLGLIEMANWKRKPFPQFKTGNNNFIRLLHPGTAPLLFLGEGKANAGSRGGLCNLNKTYDVNTKIISFNNLKISQNALPFTKQIFACTH